MKPRDIPCQYCKASVGAPCSSPSPGAGVPGARQGLTFYHTDRVDAAFEQLTSLTRDALDRVTGLFQEALSRLQEDPNA
jgi:hypothetical protein